MKKILVLIAVCAYSFFGLGQSPWVYNTGNGYTHLAVGLIPTYGRVFQGGQRSLTDIDGTITEFNIQSFTEIGIGKKIGGVISVPLNLVQSSLNNNAIRESGSIIGLGNTEIGIKWNILESSVLLTTQLNVSFPTGVSSEETGLQTGYDALSVAPYLSLGKGFDKSYFYTYVGLDFNSNEFNNNLRAGAEFGYHSFKKLWTILNVSVKEPITSGNRTFDDSFEETFLFINDQYFTSLSLKLIYEISEQVGLNASTNLISIRANNLPFQRPFSLGVYFKW